MSDTIAALATPTGTSALALIRVSGPDCRALARDIFGAASPALPERRPTHARYRSADGTPGGPSTPRCALRSR